MSKIPLPLIALLAFCGAAHAQNSEPTIWTTSFVPGVLDGNGNFLGGTEIRELVAMSGKLYAGNGYWMDQPGPEGRKTAQVFVLNSSHGLWQQDWDFSSSCPQGFPKCALAISTLKNLAFVSDKNGTPVDVHVLVAATWDTVDPQRSPVYAKNNSDGKWYETILANAGGGQVRSFATHVDTITQQDFAFAGEAPNGIYHGLLSDKRGAKNNIIEWTTGGDVTNGNANVEYKVSSYTGPPCTGDGERRISSFAEANGKLYAAICFQILERVDGFQESCQLDQVSVAGVCEPRWKVLRTDILQQPHSETGLRGLTAVPVKGLSGEEHDELLVVEEGTEMRIFRINPITRVARLELNLKNFLSNQFDMKVTYGIASYNNFAKWIDPAGIRKYIIGVEAFITPEVTVPQTNLSFNILGDNDKLTGDAYYIVRNAAASYEVIHIPPDRATSMVAVRTAIQSPFSDECPPGAVKGCPIYFGGFDANKSTTQTPCLEAPCTFPPLIRVPTHNTGWIVKGSGFTPP
jgi:hypothetical protein